MPQTHIRVLIHTIHYSLMTNSIAFRQEVLSALRELYNTHNKIMDRITNVASKNTSNQQ